MRHEASHYNMLESATEIVRLRIQPMFHRAPMRTTNIFFKNNVAFNAAFEYSSKASSQFMSKLYFAIIIYNNSSQTISKCE